MYLEVISVLVSPGSSCPQGPIIAIALLLTMSNWKRPGLHHCIGAKRDQS